MAFRAKPALFWGLAAVVVLFVWFEWYLLQHPGKFEPEPGPVWTNASVYFGQSKAGSGGNDCGAVRPVPRTVDGRFQPPIYATLAALLKGPTVAEQAQGYFSWFSQATEQSLVYAYIRNGTAYVNFQDFRSLIPNASSSCGSAQLLAELDTTLRQFPGVERTLYAINSEPRTFYEWLQFSCPDFDVQCDVSPFKSPSGP